MRVTDLTTSDFNVVFGTWADNELTWFACVANGWLDETVDDDMGDMLKLTPKALERLNEE